MCQMAATVNSRACAATILKLRYCALPPGLRGHRLEFRGATDSESNPARLSNASSKMSVQIMDHNHKCRSHKELICYIKECNDLASDSSEMWSSSDCSKCLTS